MVTRLQNAIVPVVLLNDYLGFRKSTWTKSPVVMNNTKSMILHTVKSMYYHNIHFNSVNTRMHVGLKTRSNICVERMTSLRLTQVQMVTWYQSLNFSNISLTMLFFFIKMCFFHNDGKIYCSYCNLLQILYSSKFFCLASISILTHIYIMITLVIIYHYCNIK